MSFSMHKDGMMILRLSRNDDKASIMRELDPSNKYRQRILRGAINNALSSENSPIATRSTRCYVDDLSKKISIDVGEKQYWATATINVKKNDDHITTLPVDINNDDTRDRSSTIITIEISKNDQNAILKHCISDDAIDVLDRVKEKAKVTTSNKITLLRHIDEFIDDLTRGDGAREMCREWVSDEPGDYCPEPSPPERY